MRGKGAIDNDDDGGGYEEDGRAEEGLALTQDPPPVGREEAIDGD